MNLINSNPTASRWRPPRPPSAHRKLDQPGYWYLQPTTVALLFVLYTFAHVSVELFGELLAFGEPRLATMLPSAGLLLAVLLVAPRRTWLVWIAAAVCAEILVEAAILDFEPGVVAAGNGAVRAMAAVIAAALAAKVLLHALRIRRPFFFYFIINLAAAFGAVVAGLVNALLMHALGLSDQLFLTWRVDTFAIFLGMLFGAPLVLAWTVGPRKVQSRPRAQLIELLALLVVTLLIAALALITDASAQMGYLGEARFSLNVLLVIPCIWAAVRFDMRALSAILALVATAVIVGMGHGIGPFSGRGDSDVQLLSRMQWYLLALGQLVWMLHASILERIRAYEAVAAQKNVADVLVRIAAKFTDGRPDNLDRTIVESLEEITLFTDADRCILVAVDTQANTFSETHTWLRPDCQRAPAALRRGSLDDFPWAVGQLEGKGHFILPDLVADLPPGAQIFKELTKRGRTAVAYVALRFEGKLIGAVGFEWGDDRFQWSSEVIALPHIVGQLFANMLRRRQTAETLSSYQKKLRSMARQLSLSDELARRRTATDLHDGIGQNLAVAKIKLGQLNPTSEDDEEHIAVLEELVEDALSQSRNIIADLSPSILFDFGFAAAVRWLANRTERLHEGIQCTIKETGDAWEAGEDSRIAMFGCVRELVQNCIRHANASKISIHIDWRDHDVHICVSDNGAGFAKLASLKGDLDDEGHGFGLFSLRESVHVLGGEMTIDSSPGEGAAVSFSVLSELAQS